MKRTAKLMSLLLTLCLIVGIAVVGVSAATSADELNSTYYTNQLKPSGATNYFAVTEANRKPSTSGQLGSYSTSTVVDTGTNKYLSLHYVNDSTTNFSKEEAGYRELNVGGSSKKVSDYGLALGGKLLKSAFVFDMDFCASEYVYVTDDGSGNKVYETLTAAELAAKGLTPESEGVDLALVNGDRMYMQNRYWLESPADVSTEASATSAKAFNLYFIKNTETGKWCFADNVASKATKTYEMTNEVGVFDHITYIFIPSVSESGNYITTTAYVYINGEYFNHGTVVAASVGATALNVEGIRLTINVNAKKLDCYAYGLDNYTANYYDLDYSAEGYGIDDFVASPNYSSIVGLNDIVANANYVSPNGYLQVRNPSGNNGNLVSLKGAFASELAKMENGATVYTDFDLENINVPESVTEFNVECDPAKVSVSLSEEASARGFIAKATATGYKVFINDAKVTLEWYDLAGKLNDSMTVPMGYTVSTEGRYGAYVSGNTIYNADDLVWTWNLTGEIGEISEDIAVDGQVVKMIPTGAAKAVEGATFVMGEYADNYTRFIPAPASDGSFTAYVNASATKLLNESISATNGSVAYLLADFTGIDGGAEQAAVSSSAKITAGKTVKLDLHGHILSKHGYYNTDGNPFYLLMEGATLNVYSSVAGGEIYSAHIKKNSNRNNETMSAGGIARTDSTTDSATINIGAYVDAEDNVIFSGDNFSFFGGTVVVVQGTKSTESLSNEKKIYINFRGGLYYYPARGTYALATLQGPDSVITFDGIKTYGVTYETASLVHEYDGYSTHGTSVTVKNSELYLPRVIYDAYFGDYYFENNIIHGTLVRNTGTGSFRIGAGNTFLTGATDKILDYLDEGVEFAAPKTGDAKYDKYSTTFAHAPLYLAWAENFDIVLNEGFTPEGVVDTETERAEIVSCTLKSAVFNTKVTTELNYDIVYVTFTSDKIPEGVVPVIWQNTMGSMVDISYEYVGNKATAHIELADVGALDDEWSWFAYRWAWENQTTGDLTVAGYGNTFVPVCSAVAYDKLGIKANMSLSDGMLFNLYLPTPDEVEEELKIEGAVSHGIERVEALGGDYYVISVREALDSFAASTVKISFVIDEEYEISYEITVDSLKYVTEVAKKYACGSDEASLAYEIAEYKLAAAAYTEAALSEADQARVNEFLALYSAHEACTCNVAYDEALLTDEEKNVDYMEAFASKVTAVAYLLNSESIGIRINVVSGAEVTSVSYVSIDGTVKNAAIKYVEDGYYVVSGISAADARAVMSVTIALGDDVSVGTYSLGKYIMNQGDELAKALWAYSLAAYDYKIVDKAAN